MQYIHESEDTGISTRYTLSLLPTKPSANHIHIGTTSSIPPTPSSVTENHSFFPILQSVLSTHATKDPQVQAQAAAFASQGGATLGSGGAFFLSPNRSPTRRRKGTAPQQGGGGGAQGDGAGGASSQGGPGGAGRGGWVHVSDNRKPPDFGRIADPEDIFGSVEVDGEGKFVEPAGNYQESGTYRLCTNDGILGLSDYLRERLVERLKELDKSGN